jgi:hypothetical protein
MRKHKDQEANEGVRKSDSKIGSGGKNPNQGYSDPNVRDNIDYPENEIVNEDEELSSSSSDREPI